MDLPDCPPGAEGYEDSVIEVAKKPTIEDPTCTKAEQEFQDHLNSLKIKLENGETRPMVDRRGRDISGKWIYLCFPCAAVCSGESVLQTHISGKKHKAKLSLNNVWPESIFDEHPYVLTEKGVLPKEKGEATEQILQKMAEEVNYHNNVSDLDTKYNKYRTVRCHIQDALDEIKVPLVGIEYLVEHPPEESHYEPSYVCTLCVKHGHPRTIVNHLTCFWHRFSYLTRHYPTAMQQMSAYKVTPRYRQGVNIILNRLLQRIEGMFGRLKPVNIDKEEFEREKDRILQWITKSHHFSEKDGPSFVEVVDIDFIESISNTDSTPTTKTGTEKRDPSPPVVAAPRPYNKPPGRGGNFADDRRRDDRVFRGKYEPPANRFEPYDKRREAKKAADAEKALDPKKAPNYEYKLKLAAGQKDTAEEAAKKALAYHEKNPEKHPLYPDEWKKFWNRRYKEIQNEGKDPSKHDFKPEWILFWTARMKELHEEELKVQVNEIYRKMRLTPPETIRADSGFRKSSERRQSPRRRSPDTRRHSIDRRRSPVPRRRSPDSRRRSPDPRRRSPDPRRRSPEPRWKSPESRRWSPEYRRRSPLRRSPDRPKKPDDRFKRDYRSPGRRPERALSPRSNKAVARTRSRSPIREASGRMGPSRVCDPRELRMPSVGSGAGTGSGSGGRDSGARGSRSPLSRRAAAAPARNRSPESHPQRPGRVARPPPSMQTVTVSDDELRVEDGPSPWNSSDDLDSFGSLPEIKSPVGSSMSHASKPKLVVYSRPASGSDLGPPENIVATLRSLVALEDYLGSLGPKIVDLLTEALRMEKESANSSEELLVRDSAIVLVETAKEKLKGAVQAGLVPPGAAPAVRAAVVRAAATLHEADTRAKKVKKKITAAEPVPVAGVGQVDRAQIAQQMAAALIAQGKTDVSSEELAQLVEAVVGMAEAKKKEADTRKETSKEFEPPMARGTASALQMLQSAYDENEKKVDKEPAVAIDAMDGLSDSDLETLLKNFNELSAEEQHSLIAYLKKLEAREPQRVEKLRQYVSSSPPPMAAPLAASGAGGPAGGPAAGRPPPPPPHRSPLLPAAAESAAAPVLECAREDVPSPTSKQTNNQPSQQAAIALDSDDDDDYTVEEIFQSATQKVKEDQMRQEMEIVKKSLQNTNTVTAPTESRAVFDFAKNLSSASDLLALVQASIQSSSTGTAAEVVASSVQPRSFGDLPQAEPNQAHSNPPFADLPNPGLLSRPPVLNNAGGNWNNQNYNQNSNFRSIPTISNQDRGSGINDNRGLQLDNRGPLLQPPMQSNRGSDNAGSSMQDHRGPAMQDNNGPPMQDNNGPPMQDNNGPPMQDSRGPPMQDNRGPYMQDHRGQFGQNNRGQFGQDNITSFGQDNRSQFGQDNRRQFRQDIRSQFGQDSRSQFGQNNRGQFSQDNEVQFGTDTGEIGQGNEDQFGQDSEDQFGNNSSFMPSNNMPTAQDNRNNYQFQGQPNNRGPLLQDNRGPLIPDNNRGGNNMQGNSGPDNNRGGYNMQGNSGPDNNRGGYNMQGNSGPDNNRGRGYINMRGNRGRGGYNNQGNVGQGHRNNDNFGQESYNNQRGNSMKGRPQNSFEGRQIQNNNFRGRGGGGRGQFGGNRGRGRGNYY